MDKFRIHKFRQQALLKQKGQAFIEYMFLLAVVLTLSVLLLRGVNGRLGSMWLNIAKEVSYPTTNIDFR